MRLITSLNPLPQTLSGECKHSIRVRKPSTTDRIVNILRIGFFHAYTKTATATNRTRYYRQAEKKLKREQRSVNAKKL